VVWWRCPGLNGGPAAYEADQDRFLNSLFCLWFPVFLFVDKALRDFCLVESVGSVLVFFGVFQHKISTAHWGEPLR